MIKFQLLQYKNIHSAFFYSGRILRKSKKIGLEYDKISDCIYNFKEFGHKKNQIKLLINTIKEHFACDKIIIIPSSTANKINNLERIFGQSIIRKNTVSKRKYSHEKKLNYNYICSLDLQANIFGKTALLVDDIATTGATIETVLRALKTKKAKKIIPFALGLSNRLKAKTKQKEWIYIYQDDEILTDRLNVPISPFKKIKDELGWARIIAG